VRTRIIDRARIEGCGPLIKAGKVRKWKSVFFVMVNTSRKNLLLMSLCHCVQKNANKVSMSIKKQYGIGFIQVQSQINSGRSREGESGMNDERLREFLRATLNLNNFEDILSEIHYAMESVPDEILDIYESLDRKVYVKIVIEELQNLLKEAAE
jgi:hypothetical protein